MIHYFAYGSNMSLARLRGRVPTAELLHVAVLRGHSLRFHKQSPDGSGKCDAFFTGDPEHVVLGGVFAVCPSEKPVLDTAESLGVGYDEKQVKVETLAGEVIAASTYYALRIDEGSKPYDWYHTHVLRGARELQLPETYIRGIEAVECLTDPDTGRRDLEFAIHGIRNPV